MLYTSYGGNTEKIALRMKETFVKNKHDVDIFKIDKNTDPHNLPFDFEYYDFICVGSPVINRLPAEELTKVMFEKLPDIPLEKIVFGRKKGAVFATYEGLHLGPKEAEAALKLLEIEIEHLKFKCVGSFSSPAPRRRYMNTFFAVRPEPTHYHGDITDRPNAADLDNAEKFIQEILDSKASE